ncbi:MAG: methionyl-tRNA formyltransferase [Bacilli bacterium]|nr:methionyl-tRNA formyltransferase [Bacilli bacterium]
MNIEDIEIKKELSIVFMGTPDFAVPILKGLIENYKVRAVVTQPDKEVGRNKEIKKTPIKELAEEHMILVLQPKSLKEEWQMITDLKPNLIVTCAYGQLVPREILVYPHYGCINVHASLLPKLRGGAPIHRAIIEGYKETGITIMHMSPKLDQGDIITQKAISILDDDTASTLHDKLSILGKNLLLETIPNIINNTASRVPQNDNEATYAFNISRQDEKIDFSKTRKQIYNQVRGLNSWPGAYAILNNKIMKIWECYYTENSYSNLLDGQITALYKDGIGVKVSNGEIVLTTIQPEGKSKMKAIDYINGIKNKEELMKEMFQ